MIARAEWVSTLHALPDEDLLTLAADLSTDWRIHPRSVPQSGLGMLKLQDSAFEEPFFLGEFPMASAWVEIVTHEGVHAEGAAQVMSDRVEVAEALALFDAVLSARLPGWKRVAGMLDRGLAIREAICGERKQMLSRTRVDFSLLDEITPDSLEANNVGD